MRHLGIDYGSKRIGVAVSDTDGRIAFPLTTLIAGSDRAKTLRELRELVEREAVSRVVVGLPLSLDGSRGPAAQRAERFAAALGRHLAVPVEAFDERFSTQQAERVLIDADVSRQRRKEVVDRVAATMILQGYLDRRAAQAGDDHSRGP